MADDKKTDAAPEEAKAEKTEAKKPAAKKAAPKKAAPKKAAAKKAAPKKAAAKKDEPTPEAAPAVEAEAAPEEKAAPAEKTAPTKEAPAEEAPAAETAPAEAPAAAAAPIVAAPEAVAPAPEAQNKGRPPRGGRGGGNRGGNNRGGGRGRGGRDNRRDDDGDDLVEKLVHINRVSKTVKGGKRFGFAALMIVGDGKGRAGFGHGKAREVPEAIQKATAAAKKSMMRVPLRDGRTLHHDGHGRFGAGNVTLRSAPPGTGIIAGGPMRAVFESLGVADVVTKSVGSSNPYNMIRATFEALKDQSSPKSVAARRGMKIADLVQRRGDVGAEEAKVEAEAVTE